MTLSTASWIGLFESGGRSGISGSIFHFSPWTGGINHYNLNLSRNRNEERHRKTVSEELKDK